jgi:hypothetical protein
LSDEGDTALRLSGSKKIVEKAYPFFSFECRHFVAGAGTCNLARNVPDALSSATSPEHGEIAMRKLLVCLLIFALACPPLWAGDDPNQKQIAKIKKKVAACLEHGRMVTIETYDDRLLRGSITEAGADTFVLAYSGRPTSLKYEEVRKIKWLSEVSKQVKVAVGAAAVVGGLVLFLILLGGLKG